MEPISVRKLDNFYGKDRRTINTGLLSSDNSVPEERINQLTYAKNYSRRSLLNYDGNSLFAGYGSSFYNPFFNKKFLNNADAPELPYLGYLHKTSRDIITLPVYSPSNSLDSALEYYQFTEFYSDANIWASYVGKDVTMRYNGLILRSDGHYIMRPIDGVSKDLDARMYTKENNSSVFYYIPFFAPDMYGRSDEEQPFRECPEGYTNIIIGPPDIFTIGQTYYALLDFEPYINNGNLNNIHTVIRMATSRLQTYDGTPVQNRMNDFAYVNSCAYINILNENQITQSNSNSSRTIDMLKRTDDDISDNRNTLMYIKATSSGGTNSPRSSLAVLLEWKWGLRNSPFSVARDLETTHDYESLPSSDALSTGIFSEGIAREEVYYCPFLEISARVVLGMDFSQCTQVSDYESVDNISNLFS